MSRPRNQDKRCYPKKTRFGDFKVAGHQWGWWVRRLRRDFIGFQTTKKVRSFWLQAPSKYSYNYLLTDAMFEKHGMKKAQEFSDTLSW